MRVLWNDFIKGIIRENPVLRLMIGLCPVLAVSTSAFDALGMGIATTFVLVSSNFTVSLLRRLIPNEIRIPIFIVTISSFVTIADYVMKAYAPELSKSLGVFVPLIVVNCIILGRSEAFAYKNTIVSSVLDGLGMGLGFILAILLLGSVREVLGNGTWFSIPVLGSNYQPFLIMVLPPGAFLVIGFLMAGLNKLSVKR
ncbi:MAG: RnfABCDGE type electron transport complex subunit E [Elusimicrobia bacterium]|nr:RnfABCDGE type electron transport complex subunit E [Elusimicrobiota bacterium]MBD3412451.1 RnfABCDGE type electron transport complex subunit E [Elusimicrobiota bacterium]